ncbi:sporozoite and liver stage tryptophan-rich protein, putative [Plasmodium chabaudi chabaudi]|uniref:Sporozoite and liver stage tryptophan-rich protein, putative n=1 Tax=Plasmodium chabaudi chabaudi TaxID=31271 RepID=A0A077XFB0_PLACU|nr:sporozoite and liver stage tryptophan-rich protein, putative [Plasmodium chabaudi chabaudi]SCN60759.1 sporozoite and liver stage tryptophan-rich protein, putative [Plasmodium chabaudi chabaudi]VTZ68980.1 sporozoite and liver stage tryptophan-rich protein, putative [Plasmodium chabaudi chabaudi]|eukprot:XP_016655453.1 tryptophan-rich antigen, putative [Plasmodium chabaudi chabaudi]
MDGPEEAFQCIQDGAPPTWMKDILPRPQTTTSNVNYMFSSFFVLFSSLAFYKKIFYSNLKHRLKTLFSTSKSKIIQWKQKGEHSDDDISDDDYSDGDDYIDDEALEGYRYENGNASTGETSKKSTKNTSMNKDLVRLDKSQARSNEIVKIKKNSASYSHLTEYWKRRRWKKYLKKVDNEWQLLYLGMENVIKKMVEKTNSELEDWKTLQAHKWLQPNDLYAQYALLYKKISPSYEISKAIQQMGNLLKEKLYNHWSNLQEERENNIREWVIEQWHEWKNAKIISWLMRDWKRQENEKWVQWKNKHRYNMRSAPNKAEYMIWQKRTNIEKKQWMNWVRIKETHDIYTIEVICNKDKNIYKNSIIKWIDDIVEKFISNPQLSIWVESQRNKPRSGKRAFKTARVRNVSESSVEINA